MPIAVIESAPPSTSAPVKVTNLHNLYMPRSRTRSTGKQSWRKGVVIACGTLLVFALLWSAFGTLINR